MTRRSMRSLLALIGLASVLVLAACGGSSGGSSAGSGASPGSSPGSGSGSTADTIVISSFMFHPVSLSVAPGAVVTVRNADTVTHTLTDKADPGLFSTGDIPAGQVKSFRAPGKAGSYPFICMIHQYMAGTLVVG